MGVGTVRLPDLPLSSRELVDLQAQTLKTWLASPHLSGGSNGCSASPCVVALLHLGEFGKHRKVVQDAAP